MVKKFSLGKSEKLKCRKLVEEVFSKGKSLSVFPLRIAYQFQPALPTDDFALKIGVTASRRNFKKAVHRNRIKRLLREAYRLQKPALTEVLKQRRCKAYVFFMYVDKQLPSYGVVFDAMTRCLKLLEQRVPINASPT